MPHRITQRAEIAPILPEIRALFSALGLDIGAYDDEALTHAVLTVCPVVTEGWPSDEQIERMFKNLTIRGAGTGH